jgi:hypothetical protein
VFNANDPETIWLVITNVTLGLVVLACLVVVTLGVLREIRVRLAHRTSLSASDTSTMIIPLVGPTMADGGEPMPEMARASDPLRGSDTETSPLLRRGN